MNRQSFISSLLGIAGLSTVKKEDDYGIVSKMPGKEVNGLLGTCSVQADGLNTKNYLPDNFKSISVNSDDRLWPEYMASIAGRFVSEDEQTGVFDVFTQKLYFKEGEVLTIGESDYLLLNYEWHKVKRNNA